MKHNCDWYLCLCKMRWGGGVREPGLRGQQHSWLESWLGALEMKQTGSISGGEGSCLSFVGRVRMNMEGKVGDDSHWVMPFPPWGILGKNSRVSMYKFRVKKWTWLTLFSLSWALWEYLVFPQLFLLSATGVVLAHHCELSRVVTCSPCSSLSASSTLWSSPNPPFKSELRHLYPILVSFSYPQTWLWNMLTCLIMECSLRPCWMLRDVFYMSHILFYIYLSVCMHMYIHLYALCTCMFVYVCGGEGSASISDPPCVLREGQSVLEPTDWASWLSSEPTRSSCLPQVLCYVGSGDQNHFLMVAWHAPYWTSHLPNPHSLLKPWKPQFWSSVGFE